MKKAIIELGNAIVIPIKDYQSTFSVTQIEERNGQFFLTLINWEYPSTHLPDKIIIGVSPTNPI